MVSCPQISHHNPVCSSTVSHTCYMTHASLSYWFYHPNNNGCGIRIISSSLCSLCTLLLPRSSYVQITSSPPCSPIPLVYIPPSTWETNFHTRTKQRKKNCGCVCLNLYIFRYQVGRTVNPHRMIAGIHWLHFASNFFTNGIFYLLVLMLNILIFPPLQRIYYLT